MAGGYTVPASDPLDALYQTLAVLTGQIQELQRPDGGQVAGALAKVNALISSLPTLVNAYLASGFTTGSMTATGNVSVGGTETVTGDTTINGILRVPSIYSNSITTSFRNVCTTSVDGQLGFNLSSRQYKQDIADFGPDVAMIRLLRIVSFRYIASVEAHGEAVPREIGLIAEEVDALGLYWLVDYHVETGLPDGIKFDRLSVAALALAQEQNDRISRIEKLLGL